MANKVKRRTRGKNKNHIQILKESIKRDRLSDAVKNLDDAEYISLALKLSKDEQ